MPTFDPDLSSRATEGHSDDCFVRLAQSPLPKAKLDEALSAMSLAADAEEKRAVTPGPLAPARELYGFMLLDRGMAKEALAAFEATIKNEPNRVNAVAGAAKASASLGDKAQRPRAMTKIS